MPEAYNIGQYILCPSCGQLLKQIGNYRGDKSFVHLECLSLRCENSGKAFRFDLPKVMLHEEVLDPAERRGFPLTELYEG